MVMLFIRDNIMKNSFVFCKVILNQLREWPYCKNVYNFRKLWR